MDRRPFLALALFMLVPFSIFIITYPFLQGPEEGSLIVRWSSPKGIVLLNMVHGDSIEVRYNSSLPLSLYLLDLEAAEDLRSPIYYKNELPPPFHTGSSGKVKVRSEGSGDKELLFWNSSFTSDQNVNYSLVVHRKVVTWGMVVSGSGLLVLCAGGTFLWLRRVRRERSAMPPWKDR
jgi:hypothetical protein